MHYNIAHGLFSCVMWRRCVVNYSIIRKYQSVQYKEVMRKSSVLPRVSVRNVPEEERLQITFKYPAGDDIVLKRRVFNFDRLKTEELEKTLVRITANVSKQANKKKKKTQETADKAEADGPLVKLIKQDTGVDGLTINSEAWEEGACLQIADQSYTVQLNIPAVKSLVLPECLMVGIRVYPRILLEFATESECSLRWYREVKHLSHRTSSTCQKSESGQMESACDLNNKYCVDSKSGSVNDELIKQNKKIKSDTKRSSTNAENYTWELIHVGSSYIPVPEDIGHPLKIECLPCDGVRNGDSVSMVSKRDVTPGPGVCPFEKRHRFTEQPTPPGSFRFVSYNILADCYADSEFARNFLFPYCPPEALSIDYRKQLLLKELQGYNADIICLQEVDKKVFELDLKLVLQCSGFHGLLKMKSGEVAEGTATFFRESKFKLVEQFDLSMQQALSGDPLYADIVERVGKSPALKEKLLERTTVLQVTLLESVNETQPMHIMVATVHLFFHPQAPHIRTIQTAICIRHIERILSQLEEQGLRPAVVFCGDLNAYPEAGVHEFLTKKRILAKHAEWFAGGKEEFVDDMNLNHSLDLVSACGYPRYTNYVGGYTGCLDYIYIERERLETKSIVPMPSHEDVTEHSALPNIAFPSDHIALICDLSWAKH